MGQRGLPGRWVCVGAVVAVLAWMPALAEESRPLGVDTADRASRGESSVAIPERYGAQIEDAGDFLLVFEPSQTPNLDAIRQAVEATGVFQSVVAGLNAYLALPYDIAIVFQDGDGPYYQAGRIVMNYPFLAAHIQLFEANEYGADEEDLWQAVIDITEFVLYHEVGHALVEAFEVPILGRAEDAADSLAAILGIQADLGEIALVASDAFDLQMAQQDDIDASEFWDSHSLSEQRMFTLACLVYGSDPEQYAGMLEEIGMPAEQGPRCEAEYADKSASWDAVLSPYIKD